MPEALEQHGTAKDTFQRNNHDFQQTTDAPCEDMKSQSCGYKAGSCEPSKICPEKLLSQGQCRISNQKCTQSAVAQVGGKRVGCCALEKNTTGYKKCPHSMRENSARYGSCNGADSKCSSRRTASCKYKNWHIKGCLDMKTATVILLLGLSAFSAVSSTALPLVCRRGHYLHTPRIGPNFCLPCQDGYTYISVDLHSYRQCFNCTMVVNPETEILVTPCNMYNDSKVLCKAGFYRRLARNCHETDMCEVCSQCKFEARPCRGYHDSVCCGHPDYEAVQNKDGVYICQEKPIRCGRGEYLRTFTKQCTSCPANTFRPETDHNQTGCLPCLDTDQDLIINREVVRACNITHPALFECKQGFFGNFPKENWQLLDEDCRLCQTCQFICQNCTRLQDTVCCPSPDMVVSDNPLGSNCLRPENQSDASTTDAWTGQPLSESSSNSQNTNNDLLPHLEAKYFGLFDMFMLLLSIVLTFCQLCIYYNKHVCWDVLQETRSQLMYVTDLICLIGSVLILITSAFSTVINLDWKITTWLNTSAFLLLLISVLIAFYTTYKVNLFILSRQRETNDLLLLEEQVH